MISVPTLPESAPFTPEQRAWLNGFLAGVFNRVPAGNIPDRQSRGSSHQAALQPLTILFGTQTGTAESLARRAAKEAGKRGFAPTVIDVAQTDAQRLAAEKNVLMIVSTYGEGEPPDSARALHDALGGEATTLEGVRYSVCALGDTNYALFCQCGKDFDARLEKHGASRIAARVDCDVDFEEPFSRWLESALGALSVVADAPASAEARSYEPDASSLPRPAEYSRNHPFPAPLLAMRPLSRPGSAKEVNHVEFSLEGSGLTYEAGDALGVLPRNCPDLVSEILAALDSDGEEPVPTAAGELPLRTALLQHYDLGKPAAALLEALGLAQSSTPPLDVLDALRGGQRARSKSVTHYVTFFRKLQPRLYSISSGPSACPGQVHLTIGAVRYQAGGRDRKGVCSTFLPDLCAPGVSTVPVFVHANRNFRLPASDDVPVIMIGPGTGIAPFRAFLQERRARGASGRNWLFFGDQHRASDFLYEEELTDLQSAGFLHRLDLAWSRDGEEKIYVQQRLLEQADEIFGWLEQGAHLCVCGDASRMARDVHAALLEVVSRAGRRTPDEAAAYVQSLTATKRYQRDVY